MDQDARDHSQDNVIPHRVGWIGKFIRPRFLLFGGAVVVAVVFLFGWLSEHARTISTSDARVAANMIAVSADVSGVITGQYVKVGDHVLSGDLLYEIDDREQRLLLEEYIAAREGLIVKIEQTQTRMGLQDSKSGTQVEATQAQKLSAQAAVQAARSDLATKQREFVRVETLLERGRVTQDAWDNSNNALEAATQRLRVAEAMVESASAIAREAIIAVDDTSLVAQDLRILEAAIRRATAQVNRQAVVVDKHKIRSPVDGIVDELFFDQGERTLQGFRVALLHNPDEVWVTANIKETEIRHLASGAAVRLHLDSDPKVKITGTVSTIRALTIAEASLMPNPNVTGVFTKITQRIPVRIEIDETSAVLRPGAMVRVKIERREADD